MKTPNLIMRYLALSILTTLFLFPVEGRSELSIDLETGLAFNGYNDVRIPGNTGSSLSLTDDLSSDNTEFFRVTLAYDLSRRSRLALLVAPLRINASGVIDRTLDYNGTRFQAGETIHSKYRFDSYRLTYSYAFVKSQTVTLNLGVTAKIRDASILVQSDRTSSEKTNTGFVPLINFAFDWSISPTVGLIIDGDALAAPQGRAEDIRAAFYRNLSESVQLSFGYRFLEGGADNDEVYNFALVHYASAGIRISL